MKMSRKWRWSRGSFSQIWLQTRYEIKIFNQPSLYTAKKRKRNTKLCRFKTLHINSPQFRVFFSFLISLFGETLWVKRTKCYWVSCQSFPSMRLLLRVVNFGLLFLPMAKRLKKQQVKNYLAGKRQRRRVPKDNHAKCQGSLYNTWVHIEMSRRSLRPILLSLRRFGSHVDRSGRLFFRHLDH
jgi:hypothetical protein